MNNLPRRKRLMTLVKTVLLISLCLALSANACASAPSPGSYGADLFVGHNPDYTFYIALDQQNYHLMRIDNGGNETSLLQSSLLTNIQLCDDTYVYIAAIDPKNTDETDPSYTQGLKVRLSDGQVETMPLDQYNETLLKAKLLYPPADMAYDLNRLYIEHAYYGKTQNFATDNYLFVWTSQDGKHTLTCIQNNQSSEILTISENEDIKVNFSDDRLFYLISSPNASTNTIAYQVGSSDTQGNKETYIVDQTENASDNVPTGIYIAGDWLFLYTATNPHAYGARCIQKLCFSENPSGDASLSAPPQTPDAMQTPSPTPLPPIADSTQKPKQTPARDEYLIITGSTVVIRRIPTMSRINTIGEAHKDEVVKLLETAENEEGSFVKIQTRRNVAGYIPSQYASAYTNGEAAALFQNQASQNPTSGDSDPAIPADTPPDSRANFTLYIWWAGPGYGHDYKATYTPNKQPDADHPEYVGSIIFKNYKAVSWSESLPDGVRFDFIQKYGR